MNPSTMLEDHRFGAEYRTGTTGSEEYDIAAYPEVTQSRCKSE